MHIMVMLDNVLVLNKCFYARFIFRWQACIDYLINIQFNIVWGLYLCGVRTVIYPDGHSPAISSDSVVQFIKVPNITRRVSRLTKRGPQSKGASRGIFFMFLNWLMCNRIIIKFNSRFAVIQYINEPYVIMNAPLIINLYLFGFRTYLVSIFEPILVFYYEISCNKQLFR